MRFGICADQRSVHLLLSGHFKRKLRGYGSVFGGEVPEQHWLSHIPLKSQRGRPLAYDFTFAGVGQ
jgi:hypothetical protein